MFLVPSSVFVIYYCIKRDKTDLVQCFLAFSLALGLNGVLTDIIKLIVGKYKNIINFIFNDFLLKKIFKFYNFKETNYLSINILQIKILLVQ